MSSDAGAGEAVGIRTFLIADLRGYTRYSDEHGDEAASALARGFAAITMRQRTKTWVRRLAAERRLPRGG